ncbi:MAG: PhoD-like phosphatase N-terminal domain-containing protein, partial [Oceanobacter sp.]
MSDSRFPFAQLNRRHFLKALAGTAGAIVVPASLSGCFGKDDDNGVALTAVLFNEGIASGDPLADAVIIWTRATLDSSVTEGADATVAYAVATDE